jgi:NAD(P)-dependent dehydrogenase (short-subunit alcohol dehydrogenase family)
VGRVISFTKSFEVSARVTLVAGGTGGLGSAICERLAADGRRVFFTYRSNADAAQRLTEKLAAGGAKVASAKADLGSIFDVEQAWQAAEALGTVDAVVYAAGPSIPQRWFSLVSPEEWRSNVLGELDGFFNLAHIAVPRLRPCAGSSLVATTSFATQRVIVGDVLSAVPKAGIEMLIRQIAREEGRYGIRANCVSPGIIDAGLGLRAQQDHYTPEIWEAQRRSVPLRRFGSAEAIADAVAFLLSDRAGYISGQLLTVDGGMSV